MNPAGRSVIFKFFYVLSTFFFTPFPSTSQQPVQTSTTIFSGELGETVTSVTTDAAGNSYFTGMFSGTTDFDPGAGVVNLTSNGALDVFVFKLDAAGALVWARSFGSAAAEFSASVQSDVSGNVYVTGNFSAAVDFDPGAGSYMLNTAGMTDVYVLKLSASGNFVWAKAFGGTGSDGGNKVQVAGNDVYVVGTFAGRVNFNNYTLTSHGGLDAFLVKLDGSGHVGWAGHVGGAGHETAYGLDVDASGNVYFAGTLTGPGDLDPGTGVYSIPGMPEQEQAYLVKVNRAGKLQWARTVTSDDAANATQVELDQAGNVYWLGGYMGTADLDPGAANLASISQGDQDIFLLKLDSSGNLSRSTSFGGPTQDFAQALFIDPAGNCYVAGTFSSTVDFDPGAGTATMTASGIGTFLVKLDASGNYVYSDQITGTFVRTITAVCAVGAKVYLTGNFMESVVFGGTTYFSDGFAPDAVIFTYTQAVELPITFLHFDAWLNNNHAQLQWIAATKANISQYIIERSSDGTNYAPIAQRKANEHGKVHEYHYTDPTKLSGTFYYRVKAMADGGSFAYSPARKVMEPEIFTGVKVYPNPTRGVLIINTISIPAKVGRITVELVNNAGVVVTSTYVQAGALQVIRLPRLPAGSYVLRMTGNKVKYSTSVVII